MIDTSVRPIIVGVDGSAASVEALVQASTMVGGRGRGAFSRMFLGSVSATCTAHARCPVLVVHAPSAPSD